MTVAEILAMPPEERAAAYAVAGGTGSRSDIDMSAVWIKVSAENGDISDNFTETDKFENYGTYSFVWQKTLKETPSRTDNGSMPQLRTIPFFITANLKIDFDLLSIDDYRRIMKLIYTGQNCYKVKAYDIVYDRMVIVEMYFQPEEMPKIFAIAEKVHGTGVSSNEVLDLVGVQDHTAQLVGTGNDNAQERYFGTNA